VTFRGMKSRLSDRFWPVSGQIYLIREEVVFFSLIFCIVNAADIHLSVLQASLQSLSFHF
jgi:hypothetical protein